MISMDINNQHITVVYAMISTAMISTVMISMDINNQHITVAMISTAMISTAMIRCYS